MGWWPSNCCRGICWNIPAGRFEIHEISIAGNPKSQGATDDDFARFSGLKELRSLDLRALNISDAAFAFVLTSQALDRVVISTIPVTDAMLAPFVPLEKDRRVPNSIVADLQRSGAGADAVIAKSAGRVVEHHQPHGCRPLGLGCGGQSPDAVSESGKDANRSKQLRLSTQRRHQA